jgi:hypothetical protein
MPKVYFNYWHDVRNEALNTLGPYLSVIIRHQSVLADGNVIAHCNPDGEWMTRKGKRFTSMTIRTHDES